MRANMILANNNMWRDLRAQGSRIYIIFNIQSDRNKGFTDHVCNEVPHLHKEGACRFTELWLLVITEYYTVGKRVLTRVF